MNQHFFLDNLHPPCLHAQIDAQLIHMVITWTTTFIGINEMLKNQKPQKQGHIPSLMCKVEATDHIGSWKSKLSIDACGIFNSSILILYTTLSSYKLWDTNFNSCCSTKVDQLLREQ